MIRTRPLQNERVAGLLARTAVGWLACALVAGCATPSVAQNRARDAAAVPAADSPVQPPAPTYAELVRLAEASEIAVIVAIADQIVVEPERAPGLAPGKVRLYLEAETEALLAGSGLVGASLVFLADRELAAKGRPPRLKDQRYLLFADTVPGRPGELRLTSPTAMLPASPMLVERARTVLRQLAETDPLPEITGIREVISVAGNLAGESETQLFLATASGEPVSLTVIRRPGMPPEWGASWSEIVDQAAAAPSPETLGWYHLACFLPREIPNDTFLQEEAAAKERARADYALVLEDLGACEPGGG